MELQELQSRIDKVDGFYQALKSQRDGFAQEIADLKAEAEVLSKASIVLKHMLDNMVKDDINKMSGLVTYGLKTIFDDQNLSFVPKITKKNEKTWIELKTQNDGVEGEFGSFGGSVAVIESFLLRIICLLKMNMAKLMLLDETFASVGEEYIPNTSKLIGELSKKLGLDVLLVTHQKEFLSHADTAYKVYKTNDQLKMERLK